MNPAPWYPDGEPPAAWKIYAAALALFAIAAGLALLFLSGCITDDWLHR